MREDSIEKLSLEGRMEGCRSRGRQRQDFHKGLAMAAGMRDGGNATASTGQKWV